jgi:hypothetical protein
MNAGEKAATKDKNRKPFKEMTRKQKAVFLLQVVLCLCTFGFAFPNLFD